MCNYLIKKQSFEKINIYFSFEGEPLTNSELFALTNLLNRQRIQGESEKLSQIPLEKLSENFSCIDKAMQIFGRI